MYEWLLIDSSVNTRSWSSCHISLES